MPTTHLRWLDLSDLNFLWMNRNSIRSYGTHASREKYGMLGDCVCDVDCWTDRGKIGKGWCNKIGKIQTFRLEFPTGDYRSVNYTYQMLKTRLLYGTSYTGLFLIAGVYCHKTHLIWYMLFLWNLKGRLQRFVKKFCAKYMVYFWENNFGLWSRGKLAMPRIQKIEIMIKYIRINLLSRWKDDVT